MIEFLLSPWLWLFLLALWCMYAWSVRGTVPVHGKFNKTTARPGEFYKGGSTATSKVEQEIRKVIEKSGFKLYPSQLILYTPKDQDGKNHKYTPDIVIKHPKMVVEVDGGPYHSGPDRIEHDIDRNRMYARMGFRVVRIRLGGGLIRLSPNDLPVDNGKFDPITDGPRLIKAIRRAKFYPHTYWGVRPPRPDRPKYIA